MVIECPSELRPQVSNKLRLFSFVRWINLLKALNHNPIAGYMTKITLQKPDFVNGNDV